MKRFFACFFSLLLLFSVSCGKPEYTSELAAREVTGIIAQSLGDSQKYAEIEKDFLEYIVEDTSLCSDFSIIYSEETNDIDEFGVFFSPLEENTQKLYEQIKKYISERQSDERAFIGSYAPLELPKLDGAQVVCIGRYVMYAIADATTREKTISAVKDALAT